jgi:hypothetical protein
MKTIAMIGSKAAETDEVVANGGLEAVADIAQSLRVVVHWNRTSSAPSSFTDR